MMSMGHGAQSMLPEAWSDIAVVILRHHILRHQHLRLSLGCDPLPLSPGPYSFSPGKGRPVRRWFPTALYMHTPLYG